MPTRRLFATAALSTILFAACERGSNAAAPADPRPRSYRMLNQAAPDFSFPKLGGGTASLSDYRGKVLILYFGGLWCPDCVVDGANTNALARLADSANDIEFLNIHTQNRFGRWGSNQRGRNEYNAAESAAAINAYFRETGYSYPIAFDASRSWAYETYAIEWSPSFLIIDRAGTIRAWRTDLQSAQNVWMFFAQAQAIAAG